MEGKRKVDDGNDGNTKEHSLQREFVETIQNCHGLASNENSDKGATNNAKLELKPITCTCDARFYSSLYQDPAKVAVTCYGPAKYLWRCYCNHGSIYTGLVWTCERRMIDNDIMVNRF
mmetsp:Transcript_28402/g.60512  ORF Transcript_28402/g.60512 Transcript_28402/m.60512 type:complete len:118 (+) Transcript_28402:1234-1587(+)